MLSIFYLEDTTIKELQINEQIREHQVRLIDAEGEQLGIVSTVEARRLADEKTLDLVMISPTADPPVCKIMDYGKYRYEMQKREKEAKKNQHQVELKEVWLSATIDVGDVTRLAAQAVKFVKDGNRVKASIRMKGRQQAHPEISIKIVENFLTLVGDAVVVEKKPCQEGRIIYTIIAPQTSKK